MKFTLKTLVNIVLLLISTSFIFGIFFTQGEIISTELNETKKEINPPYISNYEQFSQGNFSGYEFSNYNLSVFLDEDTSTVVGNLTVDYYNDDPLSFDQIPFHIYPSGMRYDIRPGYIEILNVTTLEDPKEALNYEVYSNIQLMWVNLTTPLEPGERTSFIISFNTTLPDGGIDRANEHGWDYNQTRIFKFASCYPLPCVYDKFDGWNIDPYLLTGDPFYYEMAYYDLIVNVPEDMIVAATGELIEQITVNDRTINHYNPHLPVREVTFSASRYFVVETSIIPDVNITVSTYFLSHSDWLWYEFALSIAIDSVELFYNTLGIYPYSTFNVVQEYTAYGGMEYPLQVYASAAADNYVWPEWYLETVIAHETAHQWFYNLVGVDEVDWGFLDEGIVCWLTDWYKDVFHPDWNIFEPYWGLYDVRHYSLDFGLPNKINQSVPECISSGTDYWYLGYTKTNTILEKLRQTINHTNFIQGLEFFFQQNYFNISTLNDLQSAFETIMGESLDWFFYPWFDNPYLPKYMFDSVVYDSMNELIYITIRDIFEALNPYIYSQLIPISVYSSGSTLEYSEHIWINGTTSIEIPIENLPTRVRLDYDDFVLTQFTDYGLDYLETTDIIIIDDVDPEINILSPSQNDEFGKTSPSFEILIIEVDLDTTWYTIDEGMNNYTFSGLIGTIDQNAWNEAPEGNVTIGFYAKDNSGNVGYAEIVVVKKIEDPIITSYSYIFYLVLICMISIVSVNTRKKSKS
ncbi:MAG: M1 family metallopeptidase [Promethearchaeota archaeon]